MTHNDFQFGLQPSTVRNTLLFILRIFFLAEKDLATEDYVALFEGNSESASAVSRSRNRLGSELMDIVAVQHSEIALTCLTLEALAFLTDEQQSELQEANSRRQQSWREILHDCFAEAKQVPTDELTFRKADAVFLTQMEWMRDVGFESCQHDQRLRIFPESPIAYELSGI